MSDGTDVRSGAGAARRTSYGSRHADLVPAGRSGDAVMCYTHAPEQASATVVICSPLFLEGSENARAEVLLADALADRGVAAVRFDYRSSGHSPGAQPVDLASGLQDCLLAAEHGRTRTGAPAIALVGTRWGAMVAASAAAVLGVRALALWDPVHDGATYTDDLVKARFFADFWAEDRVPVATHRERLAAGEPLDIRAWRIDARTVAPDGGASVYRALPEGLPVRVVFGRRESEPDRRVEADLAAAGAALSATLLDRVVVWWWQGNPLMEPELPTPPFEVEAAATADWLCAQVAR